MAETKRLIHSDEVAWEDGSHGRSFGWRRRHLTGELSNNRLGCSLYEIPPGRRSFPFHHHCANEEAIFVLQGRGKIRMDDGEHELREGDYVHLPVGPEGAHQVINDGEEPLRFLCWSTMVEPDVAVYLDSNKLGIFAGLAPGGRPRDDRYLVSFLERSAEVGYWHGEPED